MNEIIKALENHTDNGRLKNYLDGIMQSNKTNQEKFLMLSQILNIANHRPPQKWKQCRRYPLKYLKEITSFHIAVEEAVIKLIPGISPVGNTVYARLIEDCKALSKERIQMVLDVSTVDVSMDVAMNQVEQLCLMLNIARIDFYRNHIDASTEQYLALMQDVVERLKSRSDLHERVLILLSLNTEAWVNANAKSFARAEHYKMQLIYRDTLSLFNKAGIPHPKNTINIIGRLEQLADGIHLPQPVNNEKDAVEALMALSSVDAPALGQALKAKRVMSDDYSDDTEEKRPAPLGGDKQAAKRVKVAETLFSLSSQAPMSNLQQASASPRLKK